MVTIKLKKPATPAPERQPVRGNGAGAAKPRPTLAQAQAQRAEREARYQEQLRQRFGDKPPPPFARRDERDAGRPAPRAPRDVGPQRGATSTPRRDERQAPARRDERAVDPRRDQRHPPAGLDERPAGPRRDERQPLARRDERPGHPRRDERPAPAWGDQRPAAPRRDERHPPARRDEHQPPARRDGRPAGSRRDERPAPAWLDQHPAAARRDERHPPARGQRPPPRPAAPAGPPQALRRPFDRGAPAQRRDRDDDDDDDFVPADHAPGSMRLSKRMSELGIASRREADEWIGKGWVRVDDQVVSELGSRVLPGQRVTVDAKAKYQQAQKVTVLVNKPVGYVSGQAEDGYEPALVLVTPANLWSEDRSGTRFLREHLKSLVPAGRLDIESVGLLVLTQDGRVARQLVGEDGEVEKEYLVRVASVETRPNGAPVLSGAALALLRHGLELDGEALRPATVEWLNADQLRFVLTQGKKRQIRRMCEAVGLQVLGLKRVRIGRVVLGDLPPGQWRYLRRDESFV